MIGKHNNIEEFDECDCESPAGDPVRYEFPDAESVEMVGCLECGGLVEWQLEVDYSVDEITPDELPDGGECAVHRCSENADVVVQLRRNLRSITAYCDECWESRMKNSELVPRDRQEVLARVAEDDA